MVMNSDKVSLKSFDMKKINIENIVINTMADLFFQRFLFNLQFIYHDINFSNRSFHYTCTLLLVEYSCFYFIFHKIFPILLDLRANKIIPLRIFRD